MSAGPIVDSLERRTLLSGVTVVTHGYLSNAEVPVWVEAMAEEIANRSGREFGLSGFGAARATMVVDVVGESWSVTTDGFDIDPLSVPSGEMVVTLDWSRLANLTWLLGPGQYSTADIGAIVAQYLAEPGFFPGLSGSLLSHPIHLIGHSRGASLVGAIAHSLGQMGAWVDHTTFLDWHPVVGDYAYGLDYAVPENVLFGDSYYQREFTTPIGAAVRGTYNRDLSFDLPYGYLLPHSDVHLWYHTTIDLEGDAFDGAVALAAAQTEARFAPGEMRGANTGFSFSRVAGASRHGLSELAESGRYPAQGLHWSLGGHRLGADETPVGWTNSVWPNILHASHAASSPVRAGQTLDLSALVFDADSEARMFLVVDRDRNAENDNDAWLAELDGLGATGASPAGVTRSVDLPDELQPGIYYVALVVADAFDRMRVFYTDDPLHVIPAPEPARLVVWGGGGLNRQVIPDLKALRSNGTGFGPQQVHFSSDAHTFRLDNAGGQPLEIQDVRLGGQRPSEYGVYWDGPETLNPGESIDVTVWFSPSDYGPSRANVAVKTGGVDGHTHRFRVRGTGMPGPTAPDLEVRGNGDSIRDGDRKARTAQGTKFGAAITQEAQEVERLYVLRSVGIAPITFSGDLAISGVGAGSFRGETPLAGLTLHSGQEVTIRLVFRPTSLGKQVATIELLSNDPDEGLFTFRVVGSGV